MKKFYSFLILALVFAFFACTIPSEIGVRGSISDLKFETKTNFGDTFKDMVEDSFSDAEKMRLLDCVNAIGDIQTYVIYMTAIEQEFDFQLSGDDKLVIDDNTPVDLIPDGYGSGYTLDAPAVVYDSETSDNEKIELSFSSFTGVIEGFKFSESDIKARIWITSPDDIIEEAEVTITIKDDSGNVVNNNSSGENPSITGIDKGSNSGVNSVDNTYTKTPIPNRIDGHEIFGFANMINSKKDYTVNINVVLPKDTFISKELLAEGNKVDIKAEILVWFPMDLVAEEGGAEIFFPKDVFEGVGDFIDSVAEYMESLTLIVGMTKNPFIEGNLVMTQPDTDFYISNSLGAKELKFAINESNMIKIKNMNTFKPEVKIVFLADTHVRIPKNFETTYVSFDAKINYMIIEDK